MAESKAFRRVVIAANPQVAEALREAERIAAFFQARGVQALYGFLDDPAVRRGVREGSSDLLIALGGDGTMLRAGHLCAPAGVPVLGVNLGRFGFLIEIQKDQWQESLPRLLSGDFWYEKRMMLHAEQRRDGRCLGTWEALNEIVVGHGQIKRPVRVITRVDGRYLTTYMADGLIVATPTGSTAYALAAGGPILPPELRNILLVPVAPHLTLDRAIVLAEGSTVSVTVHTSHQAVLSADGQMPVTLNDGDTVEVRAGEHAVKFIRLQDPAYFYRNITSCMSQNPALETKR